MQVLRPVQGSIGPGDRGLKCDMIEQHDEPPDF